MPGYRAEVLKGLTFAWLGLGSERENSKSELRETVGMLKVAVEGADESVDWDVDCKILIDAEPRLEALLMSAGSEK